jgi:hypothetical protein
MKNLGKLWTGAVAYVSLLVGAGLSVAGNLADTDRVRGNLVDAVDIVLAVGPPLATLLVAELFVSEWPRSLSVQSVRWVTTAVVGSLATVVSWLHIHELLMARGQLALVSVLWPIAIDGLAIMAMAKLLVVRMSHVPLDTDKPAVPGQDTADVPLDTDTADVPLDTDTADVPLDTDTADVPLDTDTDTGQDIDVPLTVDTAEGYLSRLSRDMDTDSVPAAPVSTPPVVPGHGTRVVRTSSQAALDTDVQDMLSRGVPAPEVKRTLADKYGVSTKTVGRRFPKQAVEE